MQNIKANIRPQAFLRDVLNAFGGIAIVVMVVMIYDKITLNKNIEYLAKNNNMYTQNYLNCFEKNAQKSSSSNESDTKKLSFELYDTCKMEVNGYRGLVQESLGITSYFYWGHIADSIKKEAEDIILKHRKKS